jgi:hypothetical protein
MRRIVRIGALTAVVGLGLIVVVLMASSISTAAADGDMDLAVSLKAPDHVAAGSTFVVNVAYFNLGTEVAPDAELSVTLPAATQFVTATDRWGAPLPPDAIAGDVLSWSFEGLACYSPVDECCGHVLITLEVDEGLADGTELTTSATIATSADDADMSNNEASVVSVVCAMAGSTKQVQSGYAMPGGVLTYTITLSRAHQAGGEQWNWVVLTDTLPFSHQARFLGWQGTVTGTMHDAQMLLWQGRVQAGEPFQLEYRLGIEGIVSAATLITNVAMVQWEEQRMQLGPVTTVVTLPHGFLGLGPNQDGEVTHRYGVSLTIPPGAVTDTTRFQIGPLYSETHPITPPGGLFFAHRAFEASAYRFGDPVGHFNAPLTITMKYSDTDVVGLKRNTLRLWTRTGPEGPWAVLGEPARVMSGAMVYTTTHLSQFALFGQGQYRFHLPVILR